MEDGFYLCSWEHTPDGIKLWLKSRPHIRGLGKTYLEAEENLSSAIQSAGGARRAVLEFDPPLPKSDLAVRYSSPELYLIGADERFETDEPRRVPFETAEETEKRLKWMDSFFLAPVCRKCCSATAPRSDMPIKLTYVSPDYDGAFGILAGAEIQVLSGEFLDLLLPREREQLGLRPVRHRGKRQFFELEGPPGPPEVAVSGLKLTGWRCPECGYRTWGYFIEDVEIHSFVARADLANPLPSMFTLGHPPNVQLCVTAERRRELLGRKGTRGFTTRLLGVVPCEVVVREPDLRTRDELERR
jgi:hypothetical protein